MKKNNICILFLLLLVLMIGCVEKRESVIGVKKYYPSGIIRSYGFYVNDSIPIDTLSEFDVSGKLSAINVYDSTGTGKLNGICKLFYQNGIVYQENNYIEGFLEGFSYQYNSSGKLISKQFYLNGEPIGDRYTYNAQGLHSYIFYWDDTTYVNYIEYDSLGRIKENLNTRNTLFKFTTLINFDTLSNEIHKNFEVKLLVSNPPNCRTQVSIDFISQDDTVIRKESFVNLSFFRKEFDINDSVKSIKYSAIQYDSSLNKYYYCTFFSLNGPKGLLSDKSYTRW